MYLAINKETKATIGFKSGSALAKHLFKQNHANVNYKFKGSNVLDVDGYIIYKADKVVSNT